MSATGDETTNAPVDVNLESDDDDMFPDASKVIQGSAPASSSATQETTKAFSTLDVGGDQQPTKSAAAPYVSPAAAATVTGIAGMATPKSEVKDDGSMIVVTISDPIKVGDGVNAYMKFTVTTKTNLTYFKASQFSVYRRFSDFLGLYEKLVQKHINYGRIVPPPPAKDMGGMTKVKMGKEESSSGNEFIQRRRAALERFMNRCLDHPVLRNDPDMRDFLERDELPRASHTSALSGKNIFKKMNSIVETATAKPSKIPNDPDHWFETKLVQVENLESQLKKLLSNVEGLVQTRQDLSCHSATFAKSVAMLGNTEEHNNLSRALSQLSDLEDRIEQLYSSQAESDYNIFCELVRDYCGLMRAVKESFWQRTKVWQDWQNVETNLLRKRESESRMQLSGRTEKLPQIKAEISQLEGSAAQGKIEFEKISENLKKELAVFEDKRVEEFKQKLIQYLETLLQTQHTLVKYWQEYLPEAKAIV